MASRKLKNDYNLIKKFNLFWISVYTDSKISVKFLWSISCLLVMKPKIFLFSLILSFSFIGSILAESSDAWDAYKKGNYKAAFNEWLPLAEKGSADAQFNIAGMYAKGYGVMMDDNISFDWYKKAAEQGHPKAQYNLGLMYLIGSGATKSRSEAKHWLRLAYDNGIKEVEAIWNKYELWNYE